MDRNQTMIAVGLEAVPGTVFQTFGLGHMYQGKMGTGLAIMVSYWVLQGINVALTPFFGLGFITGALTWLAYVIAAPTNLLSESKS